MKSPRLIFRFLAAAAAAISPLFLAPTGALAQEPDDLQMFGSMQSIFMHQESQVTTTLEGVPEKIRYTENRNTFALQQLDLFLSKDIDENFSAFIDLEFQLNYASDHRWGSLSVQEAWVNYHYADQLNLKAGLLYPAFNHLNEIKNRLALLPYVFRPLVYERLLSNRFLSEDFIPEHAFLQVYGAHPTGAVFLDYAAYMGNSESSYITSTNPDGSIDTDINEGFEFLTGVDPSNFKLKLFGGRIGVRARDEQWKAGISFTHDYNNLRDSASFGYSALTADTRKLLGNDAERYRLGADASAHIGDWTLEGEVTKVLYDYEPAEELDLKVEQGFAYGLVGYDIVPEVMVYASLQWGDFYFGSDSDYFVYTAGAAWRVNNAVTAKAQFIVYDELHENMLIPDQNLVATEHHVIITFGFLGLSILL